MQDFIFVVIRNISREELYMDQQKQSPAGMRYGESAFDILYLLFDLIAGIILGQSLFSWD